MCNHEGPSLTADPITHPCGFCGGASGITEDSTTKRLYTCRSCGAIETITKGKTSWWYHGWKHPDGAHLRAPTTDEMTAGKYGWQPDDPS